MISLARLTVPRFALGLAVVLLTVPKDSARAQGYKWHRAYFPGNNSEVWESVAFNPHSNGRVIFAGPGFVGGIFRSDDGGVTWIEHDSLLDPLAVPISEIHQIFCLPTDTNIVLAGSTSNFYRSTDGGLTWNDLFNGDTLGGQLQNFGGMDGEAIGYNANEDALYYGMQGKGVWRSTDHGANWTLVGVTGINDSLLFGSMDVSQGEPPLLIQGSENSKYTGSLVYSSDLGDTWNFTFHGWQPDVEFPKIVFSWHATDPATAKRTIAIAQRWPAADSSFLTTTNGGLTWSAVKNSPARTWGIDIDQRVSMLSKPGDAAYPLPLHFFTGMFDVRSDTVHNGLVQETTDGGMTWHSTNFPTGAQGDTSNPVVTEIWVLKYDTLSGRLAVATDSGIYIGVPTNGSVREQPEVPEIQISESSNGISIFSRDPVQSIVIDDLLGRRIYNVNTEQDFLEIPVSNLFKGVFAVHVKTEDGSELRKLVYIR